MTRATNARIAGSTYLLYIAAGVAELVLFGRATDAEGMAAKLGRIAQHASEVHMAAVLSLLTCFAALVLAVTLYAITRVEDEDLAVLALSCRVGEGILNALGPLTVLGLPWLATADMGTSDAALGAVLLKIRGWSQTISATLFSVGSALFSYLLLRGRMIPVPLAGLGVLASVLLVVCLPLQLVGSLGGAVGWLLWLPMLVFEVTLALWLLIKGVAPPATRAGGP